MLVERVKGANERTLKCFLTVATLNAINKGFLWRATCAFFALDHHDHAPPSSSLRPLVLYRTQAGLCFIHFLWFFSLDSSWTELLDGTKLSQCFAGRELEHRARDPFMVRPCPDSIYRAIVTTTNTL